MGDLEVAEVAGAAEVAANEIAAVQLMSCWANSTRNARSMTEVAGGMPLGPVPVELLASGSSAADTSKGVGAAGKACESERRPGRTGDASRGSAEEETA